MPGAEEASLCDVRRRRLSTFESYARTILFVHANGITYRVYLAKARNLRFQVENIRYRMSPRMLVHEKFCHSIKES